MVAINELKQFKIFEGLNDAFYDKLLQVSSYQKIKKGEYIKKEGNDSKYFYVVKSGKIAFETEIYGEKTARLGIALKDDSFGESSIIPPHKTTTSRLALEDSVLLVIDGQKMRDLCDSDTNFGYFMMQKIAQMLSVQLHRTREQLIHCHWG
ncbi:MAG: Crp/Fnr family transcriptional regulator [Spirochaetota bacterium]|nr:Crp/Fnr family transcriptional regulator [Spirochaetota bacterium]